MHQSNILDPPQPTLPPRVWDDPDAHEPKLKPIHAHFITRHIYGVLERGGYSNPHNWLDLYFTGSLCTYQYSDSSDADVSLFVNTKKLPEWSRTEMIGLMIAGCEGVTLPGTPYEIQAYVVSPTIHPADIYKPGLRAGYNIGTHRWVAPPDPMDAHDVEKQENGFYAWALQQADKMEKLLRYEPDKATDFWHQIHRKRMRDQYAGKGDYSESNILYKFLSKRRLLPQIAEISGEHISKDWFTAPQHSLAWEKGKPGKGFLLDDGSVWTWTTGEPGTPDSMKPIHAVMNGKARGQGKTMKPSTAFHIEPHGRVWQYNPPGTLPGMGRTLDADDRFNILKSNSGLWFGKPGDMAPPNVRDDGYGHATEIMASTYKRADMQPVLDANAGQDLGGLPGPVNVPGYGPLQFHSNSDIQRIANEYNQANGLGAHPSDYLPINPERATQIAQEYERMEHNPQDPQVRAAYDALARESMAQYRHAVANGYRFEFYPEHDPYPNSPREAIMDLHNNKHMYVYPTETGYGQGQQDMDHPLLQPSGETWNGQPATYNDIFRAIHDFYGHAKEGLGFRHHGEDNAYRQHAAMFSPLARQALASETRGQNSWVNFGPHGQSNQNANQGNTIYAEQKAGLLPEWVSDPDLHRPTFARVASTIADKAFTGIINNGGITIDLHGQEPQSGFAFSAQKENEETIPLKQITPEMIEDYVARHIDQLRQPNRYLGAWVTDGLVYLDISQVEQDQSAAHQLALNADQLAYWDINNAQEVPLPQPATF